MIDELLRAVCTRDDMEMLALTVIGGAIVFWLFVGLPLWVSILASVLMVTSATAAAVAVTYYNHTRAE